MNQNNQKIIIFSTGVYLEAVKCVINGNEQWRWVAVGFEDDSFFDGDIINPIEYASEAEKLIQFFDCDKDSKK